jgi:hypothetical protein
LMTEKMLKNIGRSNLSLLEEFMTLRN